MVLGTFRMRVFPMVLELTWAFTFLIQPTKQPSYKPRFQEAGVWNYFSISSKIYFIRTHQLTKDILDNRTIYCTKETMTLQVTLGTLGDMVTLFLVLILKVVVLQIHQKHVEYQTNFIISINGMISTYQHTRYIDNLSFLLWLQRSQGFHISNQPCVASRLLTWSLCFE